MINKRILLSFLLLIGSLPLFAQIDSSAVAGKVGSETVTEDGQEVTYITVEIPRKMTIFFSLSGNFTVSEKLLLSESLLIKLAEDKDLSLLEPLIETDTTSAGRNAITTDRGGDCWLYLKLTADDNGIRIITSSYDMHLEKAVFTDLTFTKDRDLRGITRRFWQNVLDEVQQGYTLIVERKRYTETVHVISNEEKVIVEKGVDVTFVAAPGTLITGVADTALIVDESGRVVGDLLGYSTYDLRASCPGFYPVKKQIYVENTAKEVVFEQMPASRWGVDVYLQNIDYIGLGVYYYIQPNYWFVELSGTFFQQKLIWPIEENRELYNLPLTHVFLTTGYYLNPEDSLFRLMVSTGAFARVTWLDPIGLTLDPLSPWGLKLASFNVELRTHLKFKLFAEYSTLLYFTADGNMMNAAMRVVNQSMEATFGYLFADHLVLDLLHFKVGGRIQIP